MRPMCGECHRNVFRALGDATLALLMRRGLLLTPLLDLRLQSLEEEYGRVKTERQGLEIELARRGLLAAAFDSDMCHPIMRSASEGRE